MKTGNKISVRFVEMKCYKCGTVNHLFFVDSKDDDGVHYESDRMWSDEKPSLNPEIIESVEKYAKTEAGKRLNLAKVGLRYSHTVGASYKSFGCSKCDAIFGDWYVNEAYADSYYDDDTDIVELTI